MSDGTANARIYVNGSTISLVCQHCGFTQIFAEAIPADWAMSHVCNRGGEIWLVIGQEEIKLKEE